MSAFPPIAYLLEVTVNPVGTEIVPVATLAKVFAPEKYGMLPMTAADEVERPLNEMAPVPLLYAIGNVPERAEREM